MTYDTEPVRRLRWRSLQASKGEAANGASLAATTGVERVLLRMPGRIRETFSAAQVQALAAAMEATERRDTYKFEVSLPFFGARYFLTFICGPDRRSLGRLMAEGQTRIGRVAGTYATLVALLAGLMVLSAGLLAYSIAKIMAS